MQRQTILRTIYGIYAVAIAALLLLPRNWLPDFYNPSFMAGISTVAVLLIIFIGWKYDPKGDAHKAMVVEKTQLAMSVVLISNGLGGLGLYKLYLFGIPYDKALHFLLPGVFVATIAFFLHEWYKKPIVKSVFVALIITIVFSFVWEGAEVLMDFLFDTQTAGNYGTDYWKDTVQDVVADMLGAVVATYLVVRERFK